jgi:hypothetical protein
MLIEVHTFRVDDADAFAAADAEFQQSVAYHRPGLLRRTTARADDGEWVVLAIWDSPERAGAPLVPPTAQSVETRQYTTLD